MARKSKVRLITISGRVINELKPSGICIGDIAYALSNLCRFAGHSRKFYSVAAHSLNVSKWIEENGGTPLEALCGLLHDASEAYCADVPSPIKRHCKDYIAIEDRFQKAIAKEFRLPYPWPAIVKKADLAVLELEKDSNAMYRKEVNYFGKRRLTYEFWNRYNELKGAKRK